ncbi:MAG: hypothetical protein HEQ15_10940 [Betaproteobacteria bacterium]
MTFNHQFDNSPNDQVQQIGADQALEAMLRADAAQWRATHIHNDGFSDAVMQRVTQLPAPLAAGGISKFATPRILIVAVAAATAAGVAIVGSNGGNLLIDAVMDLATFTITPAVLALGGMLLAASVVAMVAVTTEK